MKKKLVTLLLTTTFIFSQSISTQAFTEYNPDNVDMLAHLIMGEAEGGSWELKLDVGSVVLNRVEDGRFPDDLEAVIFEDGQYECTWNGRYNLEPSWECYEAAAYVLEHGSQLDSDVIWQANFVLSDNIAKAYEGMYFCRG